MKWFGIALLLMIAMALVIGCTSSEEPKTEGAGGAIEEAADTTRMDAAVDSMMPDSAMVDSMMPDSM